MAEERLPTRVRHFVGELRRRRVFRVLLAYAVVGVAVAEGAGVFLPALGFPDWTTNLVALLVLLGLPVALVLAWAFDVVPDGGRAAVPAGPLAAAQEEPTAAGPAGRSPSTSAGNGDPADPEPDPLEVPAASEALPPAPGGEAGSQARWAWVQELFVRALQVPEEERESFLAASTGGDGDLLGEVRSLLQAHQRQGPLDVLGERVVKPLLDEVRSVTDLEGETVLHYRVLEKLGGGGMGVVYRALDTRLDRVVALKFLSAHLLTETEAKERFRVEAQAAASLDHPNLCTIHEVGETEDGRMFMAMTYYDGETLQRRLTRGRLPALEALDVAAQVSRGLARAAERGVIHRDIKPGNLIFADDGTLKIVDFGLAKVMGGDMTQTGARMGTVSYMSPEQTRGEPVDQRTDVWSVGVVLYEMLTGQRPFRGGSDQAVIHAILNETPTPPDELVPGLPPGIVALVERATHKDLARRYPDAGTLLRDVERLIQDPESRGPLEAAPTLPPEGERRRVTVLSCVLSGFESLLDRLEPDEVELALSRLRARVQGVIEEYGGVLNEFSEEKLLALFGVPVTHEDDALRAVRAALDLHARADQDPDAVAGVELRSAVAAGQVAIRATEGGERRYRVGGMVGRDAARLAAAASAGQVLVSPDLARSLGPFVDTEAGPPVQLSTDGDPVRPLVALGESEVDSRLEASGRSGLTRFVGRGGELHALMQALDTANGGTGRIVSVVGDAGVGKSRLLHEFRTTLADHGIRYVQGRCQAYGQLTPFVPFIECVKAMLGVTRGSPADVHDRVVDRIRGLAVELEIYVPLLLHLLSVESERYPLPEYLTGEDLRAAVGEALVSVFTLGARGQPLVLLLEDWHWSDGGSADVLTQLAEMVSAYPLLLVVTARPAQEGYRPAPRGHVALDLVPLDAGPAHEIMRAALRGARVAPALAERVAEKTGGNPFFIEELCHTLLDTGTVVVEAGEARLAHPVDRLTIPDTVEAVLKTRLDRLDPEAREVLRSASVIGRQFGLELLSRVVPSRSRVQGALDGLRAAGLIQRTSLLPEPTYRFKHALTLDVTYESLLERQRMERHALVGQAIEDLYRDRLDEFSERLADHFAGAEDWDRAVEYGLAAAERAASLWRIREAVTTLERTVEWVRRRGGDEAETRDTLVDIFLTQERHLETLGLRSRQQEVIDQLLALTPEDSEARGRTLVRQGELLTLQGRHGQASDALARAADLAERSGSRDVRIQTLRALGLDQWRQGEYAEAEAPLTELVELGRAGERQTILLRDMVNLGRVLREQGRFQEAHDIGDEVYALAHETGNPVDHTYACNYRGHLFRAMGRAEEAVRWFEEGNRISREAHLPVRHTFNLLATAALRMEMGQIEASRKAYDEAITAARKASRADNLAHALTLRADALMTIGLVENALPDYREAVGILESMGRDASLADCMEKLARAAGAAGQPDSSETWRRVKELRLQLGDRPGALTAAEQEAALYEGDPAVAAGLVDDVFNLALELGDPAVAARCRNSFALRAWRAGDVEGALRHYQAAAEGLREAGASRALGTVLNGLGAVLTRLGHHEEAGAALEEALDLNRRAGATNREADSLAALGAASRAAGDLTRAYDWYQQCLDRRRQVQDRAGEGWALHRLAELSRLAGAPERAEAFGAAALSIAQETDDQQLAALCTEVVSDDATRSP